MTQAIPVLWSTVIVPIVVGVISLSLGDSIKPKVHAIINGISLLYSFIIFSLLLPVIRYSTVIDPYMLDVPRLGIFGLIYDPIVVPAALGISAVTAASAFYSYRYMKVRIEELQKKIKVSGFGVYYFCYSLFAAAMIGSVMSVNSIEFYLFLELSLIPSFLLIALYGYGNRIRIAIMYLLWTHVGAILFLIGVLSTGSIIGFSFIDILSGKPLMGLGDKLVPLSLAKTAVLLMVVGLLVKMAVFGVHLWLPYAHAEAPTPISALLSPNLIGIGGIMLFRIVYTLYPHTFSIFSPYLFVWAFLTMIFGGLMTFVQRDFKRLLAYSSISQMGYMLLGISTVTTAGIAGTLFHYYVHAIGKAILFMTAGILIVLFSGLRDITKMGGLAVKLPFTSSLALIGFMHITGIPPTCGLWSEYLIIKGAVERSMLWGSWYFVGTGLLLILSIGITTTYAFLTMKRIFYGKLSSRFKDIKIVEYKDIILPLLFLALMGFFMFLFAGILLDPLFNYLKLYKVVGL